jgi:hypothetical protein
MKILDSFIPQANSGVKVRKEKFGLLVVSKRTPILNLNEDSALIWNNMDGKTSIAEIIFSVNKEIDGDIGQNGKIIMEFFTNCYELGLIEFNE